VTDTAPKSSSPSETPGRDSTPDFPFVAAGPAAGAAAGLTHIGATVAVWARHGYPDLFFRTPEWALVGAVLLMIGGATVGILYGALLRSTLDALSRELRPRIHFYAVVACSALITVPFSEFSVQRGAVVNPQFVLAAIGVCSFMLTLVTSRRVTASD